MNNFSQETLQEATDAFVAEYAIRPDVLESMRVALTVAAKKINPIPEQWETFRDETYFDFWCVRKTGETRFGEGYHVASEQEASDLAAALSSPPVNLNIKDLTMHNIQEILETLEPFVSAANALSYKGTKWANHETHWGSIVNVSVGNLRRARATLIAIRSSKHELTGITQEITKTLEPFAAAADALDYKESKWTDYDTHWGIKVDVTVGHLRRARTTLIALKLITNFKIEAIDYPPDRGLPEVQRDYTETLSVFDVIEAEFTKNQPPTAPSNSAPASKQERIDKIITRLYQRFKDWSKRGFGPEDVTWCEVKDDIITLLTNTPEPPLNENPWSPIESVPENTPVQVYIPNADYYGSNVYSAMLVNMGTGRRWTTYGLHHGSDINPGYEPTHWRFASSPSKIKK